MSGIRNLKAGLEQSGGALREAQPMPDSGWFGSATERLRRLREQGAEVVAEARAKEQKLRASWGREAREVDGIYPRSLGNSERRIGALHHARTRHGSEIRALLEDTFQRLAKIGDEMRITLDASRRIRDHHLTPQAALRSATRGPGGKQMSAADAAAYKASTVQLLQAAGPSEFLALVQGFVDEGSLAGLYAATVAVEGRDDVGITAAEVLGRAELPGLAEKLDLVDALVAEGELFVADWDSFAGDRDRPAVGAGRAHLVQGIVAGADRFEATFNAMNRLNQLRPEDMRDLSDEPSTEGADAEPTTGLATIVEALEKE